MRGMVFQGDNKVELLNFDDPTPGPGEVVVEMKASGMCGSDLHFYRHGMVEVIRMLGFKDLASRGIDPEAPIIGGHEPCGVIAEIGAGVDTKTFRRGDRVMVFHYEGCTHCDHCRSGWTQLCDHGAAPTASSSMVATPITSRFPPARWCICRQTCPSRAGRR